MIRQTELFFREAWSIADLILSSPVAVLQPLLNSDETTIALWLHGRSATTRQAYESDSQAFLGPECKPLRVVTVVSLTT